MSYLASNKTWLVYWMQLLRKLYTFYCSSKKGIIANNNKTNCKNKLRTRRWA